jgi:hypothetical protein
LQSILKKEAYNPTPMVRIDQKYKGAGVFQGLVLTNDLSSYMRIILYEIVII